MKKGILFLILTLCANITFAQFNFGGQLLQRGEYRHGFGRLIPQEEEPAAFIAQRARLQGSFQTSKMTFYISLQDVRTWGSTPQTKTSDDFLSVHEAWVNIKIDSNWQVKLGRQELKYDNARFLGNLDWALQGRAHEFAVLKYEKGGVHAHLGLGYNQDNQRLVGTTYTIPNQYKTAQFVHLQKEGQKLKASFLFWNEGRETQGKHFYRQTFGMPTLKYSMGNTTFSAFYYHQTGRDFTGKKMNAFDASMQVKHYLPLKTEKALYFVAGYEILSGTPTDEEDVNQSFSPLYGTNHVHNGYMDYFFAGNRFLNTVGLQDFYLKARYAWQKKGFVQVDGHLFNSAATFFERNTPQEKFLGAEIDLVLGLIFTKALSLQMGYSQLFQGNTLEQIQGIQSASRTQNWLYAMLIVRPNMKNRFVGIYL